MERKPYANPYIAGLALGLVLLAAIVISGRGLGASGAVMRSVVALEKTVAQQHVDNNFYLAKYGKGEKNPLDNWLIFEVIGVLIGGVLSGFLGGRIKKETNRGPRISDKQRWAFALAGGILFGFGARLARGCTSGVALTGGATLALGSWITMIFIFLGAFLIALLVRRQWV